MARKKASKQTPSPDGFTPPAAVDIEAIADRIYLAASTEGALHGLEVVVLVVGQTGQWRAKWPAANLERTTWFVFRLLTALQRMLP